MSIDVQTASSFQIDAGFDVSPSSAGPTLTALSVQMADAITHLKGLFQAYQCIQNLVTPRGEHPVDLALSDRQFYNLLSSLNEPMQRQIEEIQDTCNRLLSSLRDERAT